MSKIQTSGRKERPEMDNLIMNTIMKNQKDIIVPLENTENIQVKEVVKQQTIFGHIRCCAETSTVNSIGEEV